jgi:outer membrane immunogenic protein
MKKSLFEGMVALITLAVLAVTAPTLAADGDRPAGESANAASAPPSVSSSYSWMGFYLGGNIGGGIGNADTRFDPLPDPVTFINLKPTMLSPNPRGVVGGIQFGANKQLGRFVLGLEADFSGSGMDGSALVSPIVQNDGTPFPGAAFLIAQQSTKWFGTVRPRVGLTVVPRLLLYATGGMAYGHVQYSANSDFLPVGTEQYVANFEKTKVGWVAGGGAEYAWGRRWRLGGEYLFYDLGNQRFTADPAPPLPPFQVAYTWRTRAHIIRARVSFRF